MLKQIAALRPDAIVCTHFLPAEMLSRLIRNDELACPVGVQVTDFDLHRLWTHQAMAGCFVANAAVAWRLEAQGIAADRIHVTGIPIMPAFSQPLDRRACAAEFGLAADRTTFMLMDGGAGMGQLPAIARCRLDPAPIPGQEDRNAD